MLVSPFHVIERAPKSYFPAIHECGRRLVGVEFELVGDGTPYRPSVPRYEVPFGCQPPPVP